MKTASTAAWSMPLLSKGRPFLPRRVWLFAPFPALTAVDPFADIGPAGSDPRKRTFVHLLQAVGHPAPEVRMVAVLFQAPNAPSMVCIAPVTKPASGPASHATIAATSSGRPALDGHEAVHELLHRSIRGFASVSIGPGCTMLIVMPRGPKSRASPRASPCSADLLSA
jgi:hypothetical protein